MKRPFGGRLPFALVTIAAVSGVDAYAATPVGEVSRLKGTSTGVSEGTTRELETSAQLNVNVFGWSFGRLTQLVQNADHAIEEHDGGLLHVYTTETAIQQRKESGRKFQETVTSNFMLRTVAAGFQASGDSAEAWLKCFACANRTKKSNTLWRSLCGAIRSRRAARTPTSTLAWASCG